MKTKQTSLLKFYADTPLGDLNKLFTWKVQDYPHACDLVAKFIQEKNFKIKAAYYINETGKSMRLDKLEDLSKHENSLIKEHDRENLIKLANARRKVLNY